MKNNLGKLKKVMAICLAVLVMISANFSLKACENLVYKVWNKPADLTK